MEKKKKILRQRRTCPKGQFCVTQRNSSRRGTCQRQGKDRPNGCFGPVLERFRDRDRDRKGPAGDSGTRSYQGEAAGCILQNALHLHLHLLAKESKKGDAEAQAIPQEKVRMDRTCTLHTPNPNEQPVRAYRLLGVEAIMSRTSSKPAPPAVLP